jgi:hypothetical protein
MYLKKRVQNLKSFWIVSASASSFKDGLSLLAAWMSRVGSETALLTDSSNDETNKHAGNSTGLESIYAFHQGCDIMFHVCPYLPYFPSDKQQVK